MILNICLWCLLEISAAGAAQASGSETGASRNCSPPLQAYEGYGKIILLYGSPIERCTTVDSKSWLESASRHIG